MALPNEKDIANVNVVSASTPNVLTDSIYNMTPNVEELSEQSTSKADDSNKATLASTVSSSAVTDMSDPYAEQMRNLTSDNAYTLTPFQDSGLNAVGTSDNTYFSTGANLKSKQNFGSQFDNVNEDNINSFYTTAKNIGSSASNVFSNMGSGASTFKEQLAETGMAPLFSVAIGGGPMAILGGAAQFIGLGLKQEKDKNNFLKAFGEQGFSDELLNTSFGYAGKNNKTGKQFLEHILYNSNNPGYALKYNAYGGKKGFNGNHIDALAKFMNDGIDNNIFPVDNILNMSANRYNTQGGSNAYMTTTAAQKALEGKGWQVKGRVAISPDGVQYLDGKIWGGKDLSNVVKKKYGYVNTPEPVVSQPSTTTDTSSNNNNNNQNNYNQQDFSERDSSQDSGGSYGGGEPSGGYSSSSSSGSGSSYSGSSGNTPGFSGNPFINRQQGGTVRLQEGGLPEEAMMAQMQNQQVADAGNLEMVNEPNKDMSGVADDVPRQLDDGDFVINAPAMDMAGRGDIEKMVTRAVIELQRKGVKLDFGQAAEDVDSTVQALVSNKEMIIPKIIAEQIGYDRLTKINNRGKERVEEIAKEREQIQQNPTQPNPQGMMAVGGQVSLDENKNQPIAVPQESFAGQSSVGSKLLSPMSPEAQDDETELANRSQSFEGFMKPVRLKEGKKIELKKKPILSNQEFVFRALNNQNIIQDGTEPYKLRPEAIAGIMGNIAVETGDTFDYKTQQIGGSAQGLFQFEKDHMDAYNQYKKDKGISPSADAQVSYVLDNIFNGVGVDIGAGDRTELIGVLTNGSTEEITNKFSELFLRPGKPNIDKRVKRAQELYKELFNVDSKSFLLNNKSTKNSGVTFSPSLANQQKLRNDVIENMRSRGMMANN